MNLLSPPKAKLAEKGRAVAIGGFFGLCSLFFLLTGFTTIVLALGYQWDQSGTLQFSGLAVSGVVLLLVSFIFAFAIYMQQNFERKNKKHNKDSTEKEVEPLTQLLHIFVTEFSRELAKPSQSPDSTHQTATSSTSTPASPTP